MNIVKNGCKKDDLLKFANLYREIHPNMLLCTESPIYSIRWGEMHMDGVNLGDEHRTYCYGGMATNGDFDLFELHEKIDFGSIDTDRVFILYGELERKSFDIVCDKLLMITEKVPLIERCYDEDYDCYGDEDDDYVFSEFWYSYDYVLNANSFSHKKMVHFGVELTKEIENQIQLYEGEND